MVIAENWLLMYKFIFVYNNFRYRKIASDKCHDGDIEKYSRKLADCPLIGPKGLQITSEKSFIAKGTKASFRLTQASVSNYILVGHFFEKINTKNLPYLPQVFGWTDLRKQSRSDI